MQSLVQWLVEHGYPIIFMMLLASGIGIPVPEDVPLIAAGVLADRGGLSVPVASLACGVFVLARDSIMFFLGRRYGSGVLRHRWAARIVSPKTVARAEEQLEKRGAAVVFIGRFVPGFRAAVFFAAGASRVRPLTFLTMDTLAATISLPLFIWIGYAFSANFDLIRTWVARFRAGSLSVLAVVTLFALWRWYKARQQDEARSESQP